MFHFNLCLCLCGAVPPSCLEVHLSLPCLEEIQMRNFHSLFGNVLFNSNTLNFCSSTWTYKGFPFTTHNCMLLPKMSQVTQFLHSNVIFSRCQERRSIIPKLRTNPLCELFFICTTHGGNEWHLASLTQEDDVCLGPKIVRLQPKDVCSFSLPKKSKLSPN